MGRKGITFIKPGKKKAMLEVWKFLATFEQFITVVTQEGNNP